MERNITMNMNNQMEEAESSILHTYNRFPVVFERGEGVHLFDSEGSKYLDFAAGIAVNSLGYHYPGYDEAHLFALSRDLNAPFCDFASFQDFLTLYNPLAVVPPEEGPPSCAVTFVARSPSLE